MNNWKEVWNKRNTKNEYWNYKETKKVFEEMKMLDGFDVIENTIDFKSYLEQWKEMDFNLNSIYGKNNIKSVYEIGCGSGPNLYLYQIQNEKYKLGGIDYSKPLVEYAKKVIKSNDIICDEAINIDSNEKYDAVISNSVFSYFSDYDYAEEVLNKMVDKANISVGLLDIHDIEKKDDFIEFRKRETNDYENRYKNLEKLFYSKEFFLEFAKKNNLEIKFTRSNVKGYWNNDFIFNCYMYK